MGDKALTATVRQPNKRKRPTKNTESVTKRKSRGKGK